MLIAALLSTKTEVGVDVSHLVTQKEDEISFFIKSVIMFFVVRRIKLIDVNKINQS